ncbi:hypothetical protein DRO26_04565 [Candidatus Bathyarchaeota archaeon]|nr:MAG: hypothetical protein DRO26_04565 [Candidatus Bathyarchaeota archaeon]
MVKIVALISGGIDSPVAAYLVGRMSSVETVPVHFNNQSSNEKALERVLTCCKKLSETIQLKEIYVFPYEKVLLEFAKKCRRKVICVLCRRTMFRVAEKLAQELGAVALVTGESLGQVASQTLQNMYVEDKAVKIPVLRPLLGLNKEETVKIAKKIGTYDVSITPVEGCVFNPKKPATKAKMEEISEEEKKINISEVVLNLLNIKQKIILQ